MPQVELISDPQRDLLEGILNVRRKCSTIKLPCGTPVLKPLEDDDVEALLSSTVVARVNGEVAGTAYRVRKVMPKDLLKKDVPEELLYILGGLCVHPSFQGKGIAKKLSEMQLFTAWKDAKEVLSFTVVEAVQEMFQNLGGKEMPRNHKEMEAALERYEGDDGKYLRGFRFAKPLHLQ